MVTFPLLRVVDDAGAIVTGATVTIASVTDKDGNAIASHGATVNAVDGSDVLSGANVSVEYDPLAKGEAWVELLIAKGGHTFSGLLGSPAFFLAKDSAKILALTTPPVAATGTVKASPAPTTTAFTLESVAGSINAARKTLVLDALAGEAVRVTSITPNGADWEVVLATALSAAPTAGDVATILGFPATAAADDTPGTTTLLSRLTGTRAGYLDNLTDLDAAISSRSTFDPTATGVTIAADGLRAPQIDGKAFIWAMELVYDMAVGLITAPAAGEAGNVLLKSPGGTLRATIAVDGEGSRTSSTIVADPNAGD
jgi:hypothetical protein